MDKNIRKEMFRQFWTALASIPNPQSAADFFSDLLTQTEKIMLAKRFTIALLLLRGKTTTEIHKTLNVTYTTISSVSAWLDFARPETKKILTKLSRTKEIEILIDKADKLLDQLSPRYGRNWSIAGKEKHTRHIQRESRNALR